MDVSLNDVSSLIRLVREVCDLWGNPSAWREHLFCGTCQLVVGHVRIILEDDYSGALSYSGTSATRQSSVDKVSMRSLVQPAILL